MSLYERIAAATCTEHGFKTEAEREAHIKAIVSVVAEAKGLTK